MQVVVWPAVGLFCKPEALQEAISLEKCSLKRQLRCKLQEKIASCDMALSPSNTGNIFLQLATQNCCVASWKALLRVLPPTSNIVTQQNFVVGSWKNVFKKSLYRLVIDIVILILIDIVQLAATCCFNLQQRNFVAWQCLRWVAIRATTLFNLQRNNVAIICCSYYFTLTQILTLTE